MQYFKSLCLLVFLSCFACSEANQQIENQSISNAEDLRDSLLTRSDLKTAYFASGCFWCVEAIYEHVEGVEEVISGYSGGHTQNPTYQSSNTGKTGHAEAVEVFYDPKIVSFETLVDVYFGSQNITQKNGQGNDRGPQYRSIIFHKNGSERTIIESKIKKLNQELAPKAVAAEVVEFDVFWIAEQYHQDYERLHPNQGYIVAVSKPRLEKFKKKFPHIIKEDH